MNQRHNIFDSGSLPDTEAIAKQEAINNEYWSRLDGLIHRVFKQNKDGAELLAIWQKTLISTPTVTPHSTQFQVGIAEGNKEFIRKIYLTINNVENT